MKITKGSGNVFADLGFPPIEAENLKLRSTLAAALRRIMEKRPYSDDEFARIFGVTKAVVTRLKNGDFDYFTGDLLVQMLEHSMLHTNLDAGTKKRRRAA